MERGYQRPRKAETVSSICKYREWTVWRVSHADRFILDVPHQDERVIPVEQITERGQARPAYWPKTSPAVHLREDQIQTPKHQWKWRSLATIADLSPTDAGTTCVI